MGACTRSYRSFFSVMKEESPSSLLLPSSSSSFRTQKSQVLNYTQANVSTTAFPCKCPSYANFREVDALHEQVVQTTKTRNCKRQVYMSPLPKRKFIDYSGIFLQRPLLLHEQLQLISLYYKNEPIRCLRNRLGTGRSITNCKCN